MNTCEGLDELLFVIDSFLLTLRTQLDSVNHLVCNGKTQGLFDNLEQLSGDVWDRLRGRGHLRRVSEIKKHESIRDKRGP